MATVQAQSTNLSTGFVDNSAGPHFARRGRANEAHFPDAICDTRDWLNAAHKVARTTVFG
jgi:hypothetical protein